jgi:predicted NAD/FAD-dependent oxidoreductase
MTTATQVDHGAQYFTLRDPVLKPYLESWCADKHIAPWKGRIVAINAPGVFQDVPTLSRYVGTPHMESLGKHLSTDLSIELETEVSRVDYDGRIYRLVSKTNCELGEFDMVLWNCPPRQVEQLVSPQCAWRSELGKVEMVPCWAVMLALEKHWDVPFDGAFVNGGPLGWIARDSSKPSRSQDIDTWVLHSSVAWAAEHLELPADVAIERLTNEALRVAGIALPTFKFAKAHRWLYSRPTASLPSQSLWDDVHRLGACGDWCGGPRVEGALLSGIALAGQVLGYLHEHCPISVASAQVPSQVPVQLELFP